MSDTTVGVDGDSTGAVTALDKLRQSAIGARGTLGDMAQQASMTGLAVVGLDNAVALLKSGLGVLNSSMQSYIATSASATREQAAMSASLDRLSAAFGAAVLGGQNAEAAFGGVARVADQFTIALQDNSNAVQDLVRGALSMLVHAVGLTVQVFAEAYRISDSFSRSLTTVAERGSMVVAITRDIGTRLKNFATGSEDAADASLQWAQRQEDLAAVIDSGTARTESFRASIDALVADLARTANGLASGTDALSGYAAEIDAIIASHSTLSALLRIGTPVDNQPSRGGGGQREADIDTEKRFGFEMARLAQQREDALAAIREQAKAVTLAKQEEEHEAAKSLAVMRAEEFAAMEQSAADKRVSIQRREQREYDELIKRRQKGAQAYTYSAIGLIQDLAEGQQQALAIIAAFVADELVMKGSARMLEGAALAVVPGQQAEGVKLMAAGGAMIAGGLITRAAFGAGGKAQPASSATSTGAAALPGSATTGNETNITTNLTMGVVGDMREAARVVAELNRVAMREGMQ